MPDDEHPLPFPAQRQVAQETADPGDGLPPALPIWVRLVQVLMPVPVQLSRGHPVLLAVITLAQAPVMQDRNPGCAEGQ